MDCVHFSSKLIRLKVFLTLFVLSLVMIPIQGKTEAAHIWGGYFYFNGNAYIARQLIPADHEQLIMDSIRGKILDNTDADDRSVQDLNLVLLEIPKNYYKEGGTTEQLVHILNNIFHADPINKENKIFLENCNIMKNNPTSYYVTCFQCGAFDSCSGQPVID